MRLHPPGSTAAAIPLVKTQEGGERPSEEAISKAEAGARLCLPRPSPAPMWLMHKLVEPTPTCLPCSSPKLECRLHRKPPDCGGRMRRYTCYVVNKKSKMKMIPCSLKPSTAPTLLATSPAPPQARRYCLLSLELIWRARCKPPNTRAAVCSPSFEAVPLMPKRLLASSTRVNSLRRPGDELVWRLRKPPDLAKHWLLIGGVNKIKDRRKEGCLPALWHTFTFPTFARPSSCSLGCVRIPRPPLPLLDIHLSFRQPER